MCQKQAEEGYKGIGKRVVTVNSINLRLVQNEENSED